MCRITIAGQNFYIQKFPSLSVRNWNNTSILLLYAFSVSPKASVLPRKMRKWWRIGTRPISSTLLTIHECVNFGCHANAMMRSVLLDCKCSFFCIQSLPGIARSVSLKFHCMSCNIPVCIHIAPALSKKPADCGCITEVKTLRNKGFCCHEFSVRSVSESWPYIQHEEKINTGKWQMIFSVSPDHFNGV